MNFDIFKWLHELIDHFSKHPQGDQIVHPALAAVAGAIQPAPAPAIASAPAAAPTPPSFPWAAYAGQTDRVAFMAFAMKTGGNPQDADKAAAYAAGVVKTEVPTPGQGVPANNSLDWTSFDGRWVRTAFKANEPVKVTVKLDAAAYSAAGAQPGQFNLGWYEVVGETHPCTVTATATDPAGNVVATISAPGNGGTLAVPSALDTLYTITVTCDQDTAWGLAIKP